METNVFEQQIESARQRLLELEQAAERQPGDKDLVVEMLEELSALLEELGVSGEELRQQNEELTAARQQLETERSHYQDLFEFSPDGYLTTDVDGVIWEANHAAASLLGVRQDFLVGKPLILFIDESEHDRFQSCLDQLGKNERATLELTLQPRQAEPFPAELTVSRAGAAFGWRTGLRWMLRDIRLRKQLEAAQRESEELFRTLATLAPVGIFVSDPDGNCTYANPRWCEMTGLDLEALQRDGWVQAIHPEDRQWVTQKWRRYCAGQGTWDEQYRLVAPDGRVTWAAGIAAPLRDSQGRLTGYVDIDVDITAQKQALQALRESEATVRAKLQAILEPTGDLGALSLSDIIDAKALQALMEDFYQATNIGSAVVDQSGEVLVAVGWQDICTRFHRCHPETLKNCIKSDTELSNGVPAGTVKGYLCKNNLWDLATPITVGGRQVGNFFLGQFFYEGEIPDVELFREQARRYGFDEAEYLAALERTPRWRRETVEAVMRFYSRLAGMISSLSYSAIQLSRSLNEQKRIEQALHESEEKFRTLVENANDIVYSLTPDGVFTYVSPAWTRLLGHAVSEIENSPFQPLVHPDDLPACLEFLERTFKTRGKQAGIEYRVRHKDGGWRWHATNAAAILDANGEAVSFMGIARDVTERKKAEEALLIKTAAIESAVSAIGFADLEGTITYANRAFLNLWGYGDAEEIIGKHISGFALSKEQVAEVVKTLLSGKPYIGEGKSIKKDGTAFDNFLTANLITSAAGKSICMMASFLDITERKQMEESLCLQTAVTASINHILEGSLQVQTDVEVARICLAEAEALTGSQFGWIGEIDPAGKMVTLVLSDAARAACLVDPSEPGASNEMEARGVFGRVLKDGKALIANSPASHPDWVGLPKGHLELTAFLGVPLWQHGKEIGMIALGDKAAGYNLQDQQAIEAIGVAFVESLQRKRAQQALQQQHDLVARLMETSPTGVTMVDRAGRITFANAQAEKILGLSKDAITKRSYNAPEWRITDFQGAPFPEKELAFNRVMSSGESVFDVQHAIQWPDGRRVLLSINDAPLLDASGEIEGIVSTIEDISERKKVEAALIDERNFKNAILDNAPIAVNVLDRERRFVLVNKYFEQVTGYSAAELLGRRTWEATWIETEAQALKAHFDSIWAGDYPKEITNHVRTRAGELIPFEWIDALIVDDQGQPRYSLGIGVGLSQRMQMEAELRASLAEKEVLLREVHHRVKNNLEVINSLAELQVRKISDPAAVASLRQLQERVLTIALVHEDLYRSKNLAEIKTRPYLRRLADNLHQAFGWPKLDLQVEAEDLAISLERAAPFGLIVTELVTNALKYAFPQGERAGGGENRICIRLRQEGENIILEVSDNGVGLPPGLDWENAETLGLKLANRLTTQLHGELIAEVNEGTRFRLSFPG